MRIHKPQLFLLAAIFIASSVLSQPTISSFSPASGPVGTSVTITGTNFSTTPANNIVFFGAVKANVTAASSVSLTVTAPSGATYQPITVTVNGLTGFSARPFIITFTGGGQINSTSFGEKQDFVTGISPNAITLSDFDGDGKSDIATPNNNLSEFSSVSVLRNTSSSGNITFAPKQDYVTGQVTYAIASGDIDGDGKPDMVSTSAIDATFSIFRNTSSLGNISFAPKIDIGTGNAPFGVVLGDIDRDGKSDVITLNSTSQTISVFRNIGSPGSISFAAKIDFSTLFSPEEITLGDFDGDSKTDIAFTNRLSNSFSIYRNTSTSGNISLAPRVDFSCGAGNEPYGISYGDLDNDSKLDLAVVYNGSTSGGVQLFRNSSAVGTISFALSYTPFGTGPTSDNFHVGINDINGDGKLDVALSISGPTAGTVFVYQNNSTTGTFSFGSANFFSTSFAPYGVMLGDLEGDGRPDLAITEFTIEKISVFKNRCGYPNISFFSPSTVGANSTVTISGSNFIGVTSVTFGGTPAASFNVINANTLTAVVGPGSSGDIVITTSVGSGSASGFIFAGPPTVTSFTPTSAGFGNTVTISGQNFTGATGVSFGGIAATSFTVVNPTTITTVVGAGASGSVSVTNTYGTGSIPGFTHIPFPIINSFTPTNAGQGTTVAISGQYFTGSTAVSFGGVLALSFTVVNSTTITAVVGNGASGNVSVTNSFGTGVKSGFVFIPAPIISSFTPASAIIGTTVTISGENFTGTTAVSFGGIAASSFTVVNSTTITAQVSFGGSGNISVTTPGGTVSLSGFTFISPPVINSFTPALGPIGTAVTISGSNFNNIASNNVVYFGTVQAQVTNATSTSLSVIVPAGANPQNISVTTNNLTATANQAFIITFNGGGSGFNAGSFSTEAEFIGGLDPYTLHAADLDGDGKPDVIIPDVPFKKISVLKNTSTGGVVSFAPEAEHATSWVPYFVATGDFDGDGKKDVAVTCSDAINIFRNTSTVGNISFAARQDIPIVPNPPCGITVNDFDGDGRLDIAVWRSGSTVGIFINTTSNGIISFSNTLSFSVGNFGILPLYSHDIDGDNKPDILVPYLNNSSVSVYRNTSSGGVVSFAPNVDFASGYRTAYLTMGDLDGDGKPEIITNSDNSSFTVLKNQSNPGTISFAPKVEYFTNEFNQYVINAGDLDGDGKIDIAGYTETGAYGVPPAISIFRNLSTAGNISFANKVAFPIYTASIALLCDFNIDGKLDIGGVAWTTAYFRVISNQVGGTSITSFTPTSAPTGATITITGTNFTGATAVSFGGVAATSFVINSSTSITAVAGAGASGNVSVTTPLGTASMAGFTFIASPAISSFTPTSASTGVTITITGTNFTGATAVSFGSVAATSFVVNSSTNITAVVGAGASGNLSVTTPAGTASMAGFTFIAPPTISSFTPTSAATGATITITGTNFTGATAVSFGGVAATSFVVNSSTGITAVVASGASGNVSVTTPGGTATLAGFTFIPAPVINSFTPTNAATAASITITGTNFTGATAVSFGGVAAASFVVNSSTSITAIVGAGATGNITVTTPGGVATATGFTYNAITGIGGPGSINSNELIVNPNPAKDFLIIKHPATNKNAELSFYDMLGRKVKTILPARNSRQTDVILNYMTPGIYTIVWSDGIRVLSRIIVID